MPQKRSDLDDQNLDKFAVSNLNKLYEAEVELDRNLEDQLAHCIEHLELDEDKFRLAFKIADVE